MNDTPKAGALAPAQEPSEDTLTAVDWAKKAPGFVKVIAVIAATYTALYILGQLDDALWAYVDRQMPVWNDQLRRVFVFVWNEPVMSLIFGFLVVMAIVSIFREKAKE